MTTHVDELTLRCPAGAGPEAGAGTAGSPLLRQTIDLRAQIKASR